LVKKIHKKSRNAQKNFRVEAKGKKLKPPTRRSLRMENQVTHKIAKLPIPSQRPERATKFNVSRKKYGISLSPIARLIDVVKDEIFMFHYSM